jgi:hypothetical protein
MVGQGRQAEGTGENCILKPEDEDWEHGSSNRAPAYQMWGYELKPQYKQNK